MPKLPVVSGSEVVQAFEALGWSVDRQQSSHIILVKDGETATLSVPDTWAWKPGAKTPALLLGSWNSATRFEWLEWRAAFA